ncbi:hypothetical protein HDU93_000196 [Gonapodya sp. JEL0774]|nr:hypothetical protein HDU93_000196 [Gonapodya sp. JEL0774]
MIPRSQLLRLFREAFADIRDGDDGVETATSAALTCALEAVNRELSLAHRAVCLPSEILTCIFSYLDTSTLLSCALVHSAWSTPASYLIWHDLHILHVRELGWVLAILEAEAAGSRVAPRDVPVLEDRESRLRAPVFGHCGYLHSHMSTSVTRGPAGGGSSGLGGYTFRSGTGGHLEAHSSDQRGGGIGAMAWMSPGKRRDRDVASASSFVPSDVHSSSPTSVSVTVVHRNSSDDMDSDPIVPTFWFEPDPEDSSKPPAKRFPTTFPEASRSPSLIPLPRRPVKRLYIDLPPPPPRPPKHSPPPTLLLRFFRRLPELLHVQSITHISFPRGLPLPSDVVHQILELCTSLVWVCLAETSVVFERKTFEMLAKRGHQLRTLDVEAPGTGGQGRHGGGFRVGGDEYLEEVCMLVGLTHLSLAGHESLTDELFLRIISSTSNLLKLDLTNCSSLTSASVSQIPVHCPSITVLSLVDVSFLTTDSLTALLDGLRGLISLDITATSSEKHNGDLERVQQSAFIAALKHKRLTYLGWGENEDVLDLSRRVLDQLRKRFRGGSRRPLMWDGEGTDMWDLVSDPRGIEEEDEEDYHDHDSDSDDDFDDDDDDDDDHEEGSWVDDDEDEPYGAGAWNFPGQVFAAVAAAARSSIVGTGTAQAVSAGVAGPSLVVPGGMPGEWRSPGESEGDGWETDDSTSLSLD